MNVTCDHCPHYDKGDACCICLETLPDDERKATKERRRMVIVAAGTLAARVVHQVDTAGLSGGHIEDHLQTDQDRWILIAQYDADEGTVAIKGKFLGKKPDEEEDGDEEEATMLGIPMMAMFGGGQDPGDPSDFHMLLPRDWVPGVEPREA